MVDEVKPVSMQKIEAARDRLQGVSLMTPLIACDAAPSGKSVYLKLENLQPIGCFKIRPIGNAVLARAPADLSDGIYTASSGNSALGVAFMARRLGVPATAVVPADAQQAKLDKLMALGARIDMRPVDTWWQAIRAGSLDGIPGVYIDAVRDADALAGDATIGLEILAQAPDVDAILVPFGGGGLACGIACAVRALRPGIKIIACELASAHPLQSAVRAGAPTEVSYDTGFVSGVGSRTVLPEMWPLIQSMIDDVITVSLAEVAAAIKLLVERNRVVAEGAGAVSVAAALSGRYAASRVCAVVSGGNLDAATLIAILDGRVP